MRFTTTYRDWGFGLCFLHLRNEVALLLPASRVIRCDNRPEYISGALRVWAERKDIHIEHIQPGKPQQSAYIERFNRTVRYGWLARTLFETFEPVQDNATGWLWTSSQERPNMALGGITPMQKLTLAA